MAGQAQPTLGLYLSIPFCRSKCTYCNFSSGVYPAGEHAPYIARLIGDLRSAPAWAETLGAALPRRVDTVYLGGGTPSLLEPQLLERLFAAVRSEFDVDADAEVTMECAPGQLPDATLEAMAVCGVNRVSLGVQSFIDSEAHQSGRLHNRAIVTTDIGRLRAAGIANLNLDLIAGLAGQTFASWEESLQALVDSGVPHSSVYMLEVDEDSRLGRELLAGGARYRAGLVPHDDAIARMYERALSRLAEAGLAQYEISNFARPGFESRHNLRYWQRKPYLGTGLDASSMLREKVLIGHDFSRAVYTGKKRAALAAEGCTSTAEAASSAASLAPASILRATTTDDLQAYLAGPQTAEISRLSIDQQHEEAWFLGLRLNAGVDVAALKQEFGRERVEAALATVACLAADGLLESRDGRVRLSPRGRMISNDVFQEFLVDSCKEDAQPAAVL